MKKVDAPNQSNAFRQELEQRWSRWKQDPLFSEFIEKERNEILKEYESTIGEQEEEEEFHLLTESGVALIGARLVHEMRKVRGFETGRSPTEIIQIALDWWDKEMTDIEKIA